MDWIFVLEALVVLGAIVMGTRVSGIGVGLWGGLGTAVLVEHDPDVIVSVGQAGGRYTVNPERVAINIDDGRIADNYPRVDLAVVVPEFALPCPALRGTTTARSTRLTGQLTHPTSRCARSTGSR